MGPAPARRLVRFLLLLAALVMLALPAAAVPETDATAAWQAQEGTDLVLGARHAPETVRGGEQWTSYLRVSDPSQVLRAGAKVCIIEQLVCIIQPSNATLIGDEWAYDTATFRGPSGRNYDWPGGFNVGVQWILDMADGRQVEFPHGTPLEDPSCTGREVECFASSYLTFRLEEDPDAGTPGPGPALALVALVAAAWTARRKTLL